MKDAEMGVNGIYQTSDLYIQWDRAGLTQSRKEGKVRKAVLIEHRRFMLDRALGMLVRGFVNPSYVAQRADKLKEALGHSKKRERK